MGHHIRSVARMGLLHILQELNKAAIINDQRKKKIKENKGTDNI